MRVLVGNPTASRCCTSANSTASRRFDGKFEIMNSENQINESLKPGLYSLNQFLIASIIGGPVIGGFVIAFNLWVKQKRFFAIVPVVLGLIFDFLLIVIVFLSTRHVAGFAIRNILAIVLLFLLQLGLAFLFRLYFKKKTKANKLIFAETGSIPLHTRKLFSLIVIGLIFFITDFVFPFYSWVFLTIFLVPHFYFYIRIYDSFSNRKAAKVLLPVIVFLACLIPLVYSSGEIAFAIIGRGSLFFTYLNYAIGFYVIFIFYTLLLIIMLQLLKSFNRLINILPNHISENRKVVFIKLTSIVVCAVLITCYGFYVNYNPIVRSYSITIPKQSSTLDSLKIVCIADLHLKKMTSETFLRKTTEMVNKLNPDIIVIPGDLLELYGYDKSEIFNTYSDILLDLKAPDGIYLTNGNHDYRINKIKDFAFFNHPKTTVLKDSLIEVGGKFYVLGLSFRGNREIRPIDSILESKTYDLPIILLDHAPYCLDVAIQNKIDIQFSGHTHNGQIFPFNYIVKAMFENPWGYKKYGDTNLFVSCGMQDALLPGRQDLSIPVRTGSVSEILEINIKLNLKLY